MYVGHHSAHAHTINVNKTCALQQTTGKTGTKHSLCEIYVNITNCVIFFTPKLHVSLDRVLRGNAHHVSRCGVPPWRRRQKT